MAHIDYYMITLSPFCYLAGDGLEKIAAKHGATITYKPVNLFQVFAATGGVAPADRHPARQAYRLQELARVAKHNGLPINLKPAHFPTNPAPSCFALIAAQNAGGGDIGGLSHAFMRACWAEEKDVAQDDVVRACLEENGFDPALADSGLLSGAETFERNTEEAIQKGVFGAPMYVVGDQMFWGQDRLSYLDDYLSEQS
ncbi:2-hydroxychromene-2-carboxylate isomerase [Amylibacter sp. IMCC11727]|uniref:2-hydroxychromene-2-carboxylate isomerase n=1 Tax=Amylibacter sp. IMCC11727 TaxID=3039851 RepID=UPI00244DBA99|nr:2-hydroxychromene-2-carboxylate isomerase [Amylibacter sp. IMCC11727]WGI22645.1 2-hydroxychromene-2-carboxylate isomerase [Amylibacter sp. IMCC11727]